MNNEKYVKKRFKDLNIPNIATEENVKRYADSQNIKYSRESKAISPSTIFNIPEYLNFEREITRLYENKTMLVTLFIGLHGKLYLNKKIYTATHNQITSLSIDISNHYDNNLEPSSRGVKVVLQLCEAEYLIKEIREENKKHNKQ